MKSLPLVCSCLAIAGWLMLPAIGQELGPPPAYTPPPAGSAPAVDTPAQQGRLKLLEEHAQQKQQSDREAHNKLVDPEYNFHYGKRNPFTPGNLQVQGEGFIQPGAFPTAEYCGACHQEAYSQWRQALHSNSFRTPFYRTSVNLLLRDKTRGISFARHCDSCHNPIAVVSGALTENPKVDRTQMDGDGLTCTTCHSVLSLDSTNGNSSIQLGVPAVIVDEKGDRIPGEVPFSEILRHPERHSQAVMHDFLHKPEFCAACHKANLPAPLNDYKFIRAFTAYDEWQQSKFSKRNPLTFYQADFTSCQGCHMKRNAVTHPEYGAKDGTFASHRWLAGNTAVPFYYNFDEQLKKTIEFLRAGNYLNVDIFALKKEGSDQMIAPLGSTHYSLAPGDTVEAFVVVQNKNIGHSLIPEVRDLFEAWVEFTVKDTNGKELYHSGFLKPDGMLDPRAHSFTNRPVTNEGDFVDNHKVWTIHSVAYDNTVQAGRSVLVRYQFHLPPDITGVVSVTAKVNYRHLRQSYLNNIFGKGDHPAYPVVEIASRTRMLKIGENSPQAPDEHDNPDWMRWNNLGIALLDQTQYAESVAAFTEVIKLRYDYADAYTNVGLTEILWEKYDSARTAIHKALTLDPNNVRAHYYDGLLQRRAGNTEQEIADFKKVVEAYPDSRDARRELGITYYQQNMDKEAVEQFEALQRIDPDDLAAHYNLSILYRRAGRRKEAADQQAMFVDKKVDPGAPTYSLNYLRVHPEIATESIPWHMHTDMNQSGGQTSNGR
ncbi:tetratricopeptide repeat protein [Occallatibacter riparius]|uniref:Tetratricopeptide repeat protein n=1 Tax=Occallatibacter riparius TaxID=1002689 RepID=A0A9J7BLZ8_9BACT|nr:tetratricopeptide repeat protein [Occallatibacter riparius]UWZ82794.1 tetratricopeptide repeat protein [Occallatibacter riparius]